MQEYDRLLELQQLITAYMFVSIFAVLAIGALLFAVYVFAREWRKYPVAAIGFAGYFVMVAIMSVSFGLPWLFVLLR